jgi:hypothetical protein
MLNPESANPFIAMCEREPIGGEGMSETRWVEIETE